MKGGIEVLEKLGLQSDIVFCSGLMHRLMIINHGASVLAKSGEERFSSSHSVMLHLSEMN